MSVHCWKLSPSDFTFLWEECKRCFFLKVVAGYHRPPGIMPGIFSTIDSRMKQFYVGRRTEEVSRDLPPGIVRYADQWVESQPITFRNRNSSCFIRGKLDAVVGFDDCTYGVVDFKTTDPRAEHVPLYSRQLHAYAFCLENASRTGFSLGPITKLGLLVFEPSAYEQERCGSALLSGEVTWVEIARDEDSFLDFIEEVLSVLELPLPPMANPGCKWCEYHRLLSNAGNFSNDDASVI